MSNSVQSITNEAVEKLMKLKEEVCRRALAQDRDLLHWQWVEMPEVSVLVHTPSNRTYARVTIHFEGYRIIINAEFPVDFYKLEKM